MGYEVFRNHIMEFRIFWYFGITSALKALYLLRLIIFATKKQAWKNNNLLLSNFLFIWLQNWRRYSAQNKGKQAKIYQHQQKMQLSVHKILLNTLYLRCNYHSIGENNCIAQHERQWNNWVTLYLKISQNVSWHSSQKLPPIFHIFLLHYNL